MKSRKPSIPYIIWMLVFTMIPIIMIGFTAFTDKDGNFSLEPFSKAFFYTEVFFHSLWIALISTVICLVIAYPLAYLITRMKASTQNTVIMLLMIPMWQNGSRRRRTRCSSGPIRHWKNALTRCATSLRRHRSRTAI